MTNEQIIERINAMPSEKWFTSVDIAGKYSNRIAHTLYQMASVNDDVATLQVRDGRVLISSAGGITRYQWVAESYWLGVLNG
jgi:hypothetical protein